MKKISILVIISFLMSCKKQEKNIEQPTLNQTIEFITQKINNRDVIGSQGMLTNVKFYVINNNVTYSYEFIFAKENAYYRVTESFNLKDIKDVGINNSTFEYIKLTLDKYNCRRTVESLNNRSLASYGAENEIYLNEVFINVNSFEQKAIEKAFQNINSIFKEEIGEDFFNEYEK